MAKFDIGDEVYCKSCPEEIYTVKDVNILTSWIPIYTLSDSYGRKFESYCSEWEKIITEKDALRYGKILTDDMYYVCRPEGDLDVRIRTIRYEYHIFYHKMVNGEVVEFKELTV